MSRIIAQEEALEPFCRFGVDQCRGGSHKNKNPDAILGVPPGDMRSESVCARAGVSTKSLCEWRNGKRPMIPWNTADRVIQGLGLFWDDVWTPENTDPELYARMRKALEQ